MRACVEVMTVEIQGIRILYLAPKVTCICYIRSNICFIRFSVVYSVLFFIFLFIFYFSIESFSKILIYFLYLLSLLTYSYKLG